MRPDTMRCYMEQAELLMAKLAEPPPPEGWYESGKTAEDWDRHLQGEKTASPEWNEAYLRRLALGDEYHAKRKGLSRSAGRVLRNEYLKRIEAIPMPDAHSRFKTAGVNVGPPPSPNRKEKLDQQLVLMKAAAWFSKKPKTIIGFMQERAGHIQPHIFRDGKKLTDEAAQHAAFREASVNNPRMLHEVPGKLTVQRGGGRNMVTYKSKALDARGRNMRLEVIQKGSNNAQTHNDLIRHAQELSEQVSHSFPKLGPEDFMKEAWAGTAANLAAHGLAGVTGGNSAQRQRRQQWQPRTKYAGEDPGKSQQLVLMKAAAALREKVDVLVHDGKGNLLVAKKGPSYAFPGGGLDGDNPSDAARKEVLEEVGYDIDNPQRVGLLARRVMWTDPELKKKMTQGGTRPFDGSKLHFRSAKATGKNTSLLGEAGDAMTGAKWVPIADVKENLRQAAASPDNIYREFDVHKLKAVTTLEKRLGNKGSMLEPPSRKRDSTAMLIGKAFRDAGIIAGSASAGYFGGGILDYGVRQTAAPEWWRGLPPETQGKILRTAGGVGGIGLAASYLATRAMHNRARYHEQNPHKD